MAWQESRGDAQTFITLAPLTWALTCPNRRIAGCGLHLGRACDKFHKL
jgi:hypothetical protein